LLFGSSLFGVRVILIAFAYSLLFVALGLARIEQDAHLTLTPIERVALYLCGALPCMIIDVAILAWCRIRLRRLAETGVGVRATLIAVLAMSYVGIGLAVLASQAVGGGVLPRFITTISYDIPPPPLLYVWVASPITWPYIIASPNFSGDVNTLYTCLPAGLSGITVALALGVATLILKAPRFVGRPVSVALESWDGGKRGVFASVGAAVAVVGNVLHTILKGH
jgi:hypothetical protein